MRHDKVSIKVVPDIRREKDGMRFPLKLRITYKGSRRYYSIGHDATMQEWTLINSANTKGELRKVKNNILSIENEAIKCCQGITAFSYKQFEKEFFYQRKMFESLQATYKSYILELKNNNQDGTATGYQTALNSFIKFKPNLDFEDVDKSFLESFERWMLENGKSITTVGIYVRTLRAIINLAKSKGIKFADYPFGRRKYMIPSSRNVKKALTIEEIEKIFHYSAQLGSPCDKARNFWIFSYLCNGINVMDIAYLKWSDVDKEKIVFERAKTKRTKRDNATKIVVLRNRHINDILQKYGSLCNSNRNTFIFDIIADLDSSETARKKVQQFTKVTNFWMKRIGEELGFDLKLTTYVARHSFATILVRSGAPIALASQTLGHSNILTTQRYFAGFDLDAQAKYLTALTNF
jgi:integrase/recombinase XerD